MLIFVCDVPTSWSLLDIRNDKEKWDLRLEKGKNLADYHRQCNEGEDSSKGKAGSGTRTKKPSQLSLSSAY